MGIQTLYSANTQGLCEGGGRRGWHRRESAHPLVEPPALYPGGWKTSRCPRKAVSALLW